tara:strand:- start:797 stop:1576 length:780 start_codon:yes stop_codon:yes gene_type:complete
MLDTKKTNNIVVFDLDETLGNFTELSIFWEALNKYHKKSLTEKDFFSLLDTFPNFLRPNIHNIIKYIIQQKKKNKCDSIMIYTNNQGNKKWINMISRYFDYKLKQPTFDKIIAAFKVKGQHVEMCRTTHDKSVNDLFRCTQLPENTQICFIDDQYHPLMKHDNVYYINVKPYNYSINFQTMANKYFITIMKDDNKDEFIYFMTTHMNTSGYVVIEKDEAEHKVDKVISKKLLSHLKEFFGSKNKTKRRKHNKRNKTEKL